jgi:hypothetical protein
MNLRLDQVFLARRRSRIDEGVGGGCGAGDRLHFDFSNMGQLSALESMAIASSYEWVYPFVGMIPIVNCKETARP